MINYFKKVAGNLSLPSVHRIHGYEIKRMPLGAYITALQRLENFLQEALELIFPGMSPEDIFAQLKSIDTAALGKIAVRAFTALPKYAAELLAVLTGIPEERLLNDPKIGLDGLMEILNAWIEVNNIENFISAARDLKAKAKTQAAGSGSRS